MRFRAWRHQIGWNISFRRDERDDFYLVFYLWQVREELSIRVTFQYIFSDGTPFCVGGLQPVRICVVEKNKGF